MLGLLLLIKIINYTNSEFVKGVALSGYILGLVTIPFWDGIYAYFTLNQACEEGAEVKVVGAPYPTSGIYVNSLEIAKDVVNVLGYDYAETASVRVFKDSSGNLMLRMSHNPLKEVVLQKQEQEFNFLVQRHLWTVARNGRTIAQFDNYTSNGGWVQSLLAGYVGTGWACSNSELKKLSELLKKAAPLETSKTWSTVTLPKIEAEGGFKSLQAYLKEDSSGRLHNLLYRFVQEQDFKRADDYLEEFLVRIGNGYDEPFDAKKGIGENIIAVRHLRVLETYYDKKLTDEELAKLSKLEFAYLKLFEKYRAKLVLDTKLQGYVTEQELLNGQVTQFISKIDKLLIAEPKTGIAKLKDVSRLLLGLGMHKSSSYIALQDYYTRKSKEIGNIFPQF